MVHRIGRGDRAVAVETQGSSGPWIVCVPGLGDVRGEYRFLAPQLVETGHRVALMDLRGHGESDVGFAEYTPAAVGADVVALLETLDGPAIVVGTSMTAASAVWAAAEAEERVAGLVLCGPFVRDVPQNPLLPLLLSVMFAWPWGAAAWASYYRTLYPTRRPDDLDAYVAHLKRSVGEPGRMAALRAMMRASKAECEARIDEVRAPSLVVMGTRDPDFKDPAAEASLVAERLRGTTLLVEGAGHYPHAEMPEIVGPRVVAFAKEHAGA
ncbi:MAG: alpha/beta hydrolase [Labilithrix sp.]|nr:alpha/beta hydrolase [Labilithrix sp.]